MKETKDEIRARIDELEYLRKEFPTGFSEDLKVREIIDDRINELRRQEEIAYEDIFKSMIRSHEAVCAAKKMGEKEAYGQDPAVYYTLAINGEAGELANKIVKAFRFGKNPSKAILEAVISELPDIFIYGAVLAYTLDLDLTKLVSDKVEIVIGRALSGYYGGPLNEEL
jgi:NTP pyrophosphatase (non-canonical NTP hydrolase)